MIATMTDITIYHNPQCSSSLNTPILMQRPIVVTPLGMRVCRPAQTVLEILPAAHSASR